MVQPECRSIRVFLALLVVLWAAEAAVKYPVVIVPGDAGSQLLARINKPSAPHVWCDKQSDWYYIWLSVSQLVPYVIECWVDNIRMVLDSKKTKFMNAPGVEIKAPGWGNTSTMEYLDPTVDHPGEYFAPLVNALLEVGYERGLSLRGAPYDFRYTPESEYAQTYVLPKLKQLVEETYVKNGNSPVILISHSMGCPYTLYFLNHLSQEWKDKYVKSWVPISGPFGGSMRIVQLYASGYSLGLPDIVLEPLNLRPAQRSFASSAYLFPSKEFWSDDEVLVKTDNRTYTVADAEAFFTDIGYPDGIAQRKIVPPVVTGMPPNVPVYCLHGSDIPTPDTLIYGPGKFPDHDPELVNGDGDGTVNMRSLLGCARWKTQQKQPIVIQAYSGSEHNDVLGDARLLTYLKKIVVS